MGHGSGPAHRLTFGERREIERRVRSGVKHVEVAAALGCSAKSVQRMLLKTGGVKSRAKSRALVRLSVGEREEISRGLEVGASARTLATRLGRAPSTISREIRAGGGRRRYRAWWADERAYRQAGRPKAAKLRTAPRLRAEVERGLRRRWSPQQIAARLLIDFPDEPEMRVSHETIYQSLFVQGRGALRAELARCLRTGRTQRRAQGRPSGTGQLSDMVLLSERPAEADDRAVPGHWEGDLMLGQRGASAVATLVERTTRLVLLVELPDGRLATDVQRALAAKIQELPTHLRRSLTWDQGKEMAEHVRFTSATGVQVYFCDPRSPWQRATNENSNGLLRQYLPKGTNLAQHSQAQLDRIAAELNARPRQTLGWRTPSEAFIELVR